MPYQHHLPATYLAFFSRENIHPRRERKVHVADLIAKRLYIAKAQNLAAKRDVYTEWMDETWRGIEANLSQAVQALFSRTLSADLWLRCLVPFVASLLVRGPDADKRYNLQVGNFANEELSFGKSATGDGWDIGRCLEFQRLLAPILAGHWVLLKAAGEGEIITSDTAWMGWLEPSSKKSSLCVPLTPRHVLGIIPETRRPILKFIDGQWRPAISYITLAENNHLSLNKVIAEAAERCIYGASQSVVSPYIELTPLGQTGLRDYTRLDFLTGAQAIPHEFTWQALVAKLDREPSLIDSFSLDFVRDAKQLQSGWMPRLVLPGNLPRFLPGLRVVEDTIEIDLYTIEAREFREIVSQYIYGWSIS